MLPNSAWYVLWVLTGEERNLLPRILAIDGIEDAIVPVEAVYRRKAGIWHMVETVFFPGYIFVKCNPTGPLYYRMRNMGGILGWLGMDGRQPAPVPDHEMRLVELLAKAMPEEIIRKLKLDVDRRSRRAKGKINLMGKDHKISVGLPDMDKQPEASGG